MRPQLNASVEPYVNDGKLVVLAVAKESKGAEVRNHLREYPKVAVVALHDEETWHEFNPAPSFYLIDPTGTIRMRGRGAGVLEPLIALLGQVVR